MTDALKRLSDEGVAIWLDDLSRKRLNSGNLAELVQHKHVVGVTTNPTIFQKAIGGGDSSYDGQLKDLAVRKVTTDEAVRMITTSDVRDAADVLRPVYDASNGRDGRVSIEVDPRLAHETAATVAEAKQLWWLVDRPNVFIKIPATRAGLPAIAEVIGKGISVNVTLIFSLERYKAVIDAYLTGLEAAKAKGLDLSQIESVASFFVSRVDTEIDKRLEKVGGDAKDLRSKAALANARLAYQAYEGVFGSVDGKSAGSARWVALEAAGAKPQRPLWASTGVKDSGAAGHPLRHRAGRPRHRQHDARGHPGRHRRPRRGHRRHHRPQLRRRQGRDGRHRRRGRRLRRRRPGTGGRGRREVRAVLERAARHRHRLARLLRRREVTPCERRTKAEPIK